MSLLTDSTYSPSLIRCTSCCRPLSRRDKAICYDGTMPPILLGECCAETVITALLVDFATVIDLDEAFPSPWIHLRNPRQQADAAREIYDCYDRRAKERGARK
jgi:hypothetical protein